MTKNEMDMTLSKRGCVTRHVGHMNPLITNAIQISTMRNNQAPRIRYQPGRSESRRLNKRNESHSTSAKIADMKTKAKIIRAMVGMDVKLKQIYNYDVLFFDNNDAKLAKLFDQILAFHSSNEPAGSSDINPCDAIAVTLVKSGFPWSR